MFIDWTVVSPKDWHVNLSSNWTLQVSSKFSSLWKGSTLGKTILIPSTNYRLECSKVTFAGAYLVHGSCVSRKSSSHHASTRVECQSTIIRWHCCCIDKSLLLHMTLRKGHSLIQWGWNRGRCICPSKLLLSYATEKKCFEQGVPFKIKTSKTLTSCCFLNNLENI